MTETSTEPSPISLEEDDDTEDSQEQRKEEPHLKAMKRSLLLLLADIDIHRKVNLQDAEVTKEHQDAFNRDM